LLDIQKTKIDGVLLITPKRFSDPRGFFVESYNSERFRQAGIADIFVQDNHSLSIAPGTVRGLHYQAPPRAQAKLVRVLKGSIIDVAVDARKSSPTFGKHVRALLSAENGAQLLVPAGFCTALQRSNLIPKSPTRSPTFIPARMTERCDGTLPNSALTGASTRRPPLFPKRTRKRLSSPISNRRSEPEKGRPSKAGASRNVGFPCGLQPQKAPPSFAGKGAELPGPRPERRGKLTAETALTTAVTETAP